MNNNLKSKQELIDELLSRVERTGISWGSSDIDKNSVIDLDELENDFTHLIVNAKLLDLMKFYNVDLDEFCEDNEIDYVSQEMDTYNYSEEFMHVTSIRNLESIKNNGLIVNPEVCSIPDLGEGIYAVEEYSGIAIENLKNFLRGYYQDKLLVVRLKYTGKYNYCIKGEGHEGYIVLKTKKIDPKSLSFEEMTLNDFLLFIDEEY